MTIRRRWVLVLIGFLVAASAVAQPTARPSGVAAGAPGPAARTVLGLPMRDSAWWVPLASAAVPGYGQKLLGQDRFVAYLAVEAYALANHFSAKAGADRDVRRYRALARDVARAFVPGNAAIGSWDYYELLEKHLESGVYDRTPGTGVFSPEINLSTFNGEVWLRARQLSSWPDVDVEPDHGSPAYRAAVAYYAARAVAPEFRWSWHNAQLEKDLYRQTIIRANDYSRDARQFLAVIAVNHALALVDAFVTLRLRGGVGATRGSYQIFGSVPIR